MSFFSNLINGATKLSEDMQERAEIASSLFRR